MLPELLSSFSDSCSPLFMTSALTSLYAGERQRTTQYKNTEEQRAHREYMEAKKQEYEDRRFSVDVFSRRIAQERGRTQFILESKHRLENARSHAEFQHFSTHCWPLEINIATIWDMQRSMNPNVPAPITVILSRPNATAAGLIGEYSNITNSLKEYTRELGDIDFLEDPWKAAANNAGGIAQSINIHHVMQGYPTLIITPQLIAEKLYFNITFWSFGRGLGSIQHQSIFEMNYDYANLPVIKAKVKDVLLAITGSVRDSYVAIEHHRPATLPNCFGKRLMEHQDIREKILAPQYGDLQKLCSGELNTPVLADSSEQRKLRDSLQNFSLGRRRLS